KPPGLGGVVSPRHSPASGRAMLAIQEVGRLLESRPTSRSICSVIAFNSCKLRAKSTQDVVLHAVSFPISCPFAPRTGVSPDTASLTKRSPLSEPPYLLSQSDRIESESTKVAQEANTVLVIDDDPAIRSLIARLVELFGFRSVTAPH